MSRRILQINTVAVHGSTGRITEGIGSSAIDHGYESYIAYGRGNPSDSKSSLIHIGSSASVYEHLFESRLFDRQGLASRLATKRLINSIIKINPDIIHLHNIHGNYLNYKILFEYLVLSNKPVVWTIHDCWPITGHCVHYTAVGCEKWKTGCYDCPRLNSYPKSLFMDRSRLNYCGKKDAFTSPNRMYIVPVSKWLAGVIQQSFMSKYPCLPIYNGIDVSIFCPKPNSIGAVRRKYGLGNKHIVLGVATGWSAENGLFDFIELRNHLPDDYLIVLVGVTDKIRSLLPEGILGIHRTDSQEDLANLYSVADIFVNGSFEETFGLVTVEALACGTPVIVYNSTACPEIVSPDVGYVIPVQDIHTLASTIKSHIALPDNQKLEQSKKCSLYARSKFDQNSQYGEYVKLYDSILFES